MREAARSSGFVGRRAFVYRGYSITASSGKAGSLVISIRLPRRQCYVMDRR